MAGATRHTSSSSRPSITTGVFARTAVARVAVDGGGATPSPEGDVAVCSRIASRATTGMTGAPVDLVGRLDRSYGERVAQVPVVTRTEQAPGGSSPGARPSSRLSCASRAGWARPGRRRRTPGDQPRTVRRSEEHTSELQSRGHLVCRLLLEKKKPS